MQEVPILHRADRADQRLHQESVLSGAFPPSFIDGLVAYFTDLASEQTFIILVDEEIKKGIRMMLSSWPTMPPPHRLKPSLMMV